MLVAPAFARALDADGDGVLSAAEVDAHAAAVLVGLGLLLVTADPLLARPAGPRSVWLAARLPLCSAVVVAVLGCAMTVSGVIGVVG